MGDIIELVAAVMGLSIPLSVIIGVFYLKSKKLSLKQFSDEERQVLLELKTENSDLKRRLERLELSIGPSKHDESDVEEVKELDVAKRLELLAQKQKFNR